MKPHQALTIAGLCFFSVWYSALHAAADTLSPGRQMILDRGLQIQGLVFTEGGIEFNISRWLSANFSTINLHWTPNPILLGQMPGGTPWSRWVWTGAFLLSSDDLNYVDDFVSFQYFDEIADIMTPSRLDEFANAYALIHDNYPHTLAHTNFYGGQLTAAELATYMQATEPDMVMFDYYPGFSFSTSNRNSWYSNMQMYRTAGLAGNDGTGQSPIPYAQYLDLYRTSYGASVPSESFVRLQQNASWAFGYTFVSAFVYNDYPPASVYPVIFSSTGDSSPTPVFNYVAETNRQSRNLGPALVRLVSTDIRMIPGTGHSVSGTGITAWAPGANGGNDYITAITPTLTQGGAADTSYNDILVGYFKPLLSDNSDYPFASGTHFMIVNGAASGTAAASAQWYHQTFNFGSSGFNALERLSRDTGLVELIPLIHVSGPLYSLDINLPGGTGDLFRYSFVGGDLNSDGIVDLSDYAILKSHWLQTTNGTPSSGDLNGDGKVDIADFGLFKLAYQNANGGGSDLAAPVPEPGTFVMLISGLATGLLVCFRRRGQRAHTVPSRQVSRGFAASDHHPAG